MALTCNMTLNVASCTAGQSPSPQATLQVYNPNAIAVAVTGIALTFTDTLGVPINVAANAPTPAMGPGQTVVAPPLGSINFGPFPIAVGSAANANSFLAQPPADLSPINPQLAQPPLTQMFVGAVVYGSDGSSNLAGVAGLTVAFTAQPPVLYQGGSLQLNGANNLVTGLIMGVL